jgi:hypothetical protein
MTQCKKSGSLAILAAALVLFAAAAAYAATVKTGSFYEVRIETTRASDGGMTAAITTVGKNGYHCNMLYPWKLTVNGGDGITLAKPVQKKQDAAQFTEAAVVFRVPYAAAEAVQSMSASLKLSLCDDKQCQMETVALSWPAR